MEAMWRRGEVPRLITEPIISVEEEQELIRGRAAGRRLPSELLLDSNGSRRRSQQTWQVMEIKSELIKTHLQYMFHHMGAILHQQRSAGPIGSCGRGLMWTGE